MFIEKHRVNGENGILLAFIKSLNVRAYPCGRRRAELVENAQYIPFDPEARLNTESNNRKYSSLNGFSQTYLNKWDESDNQLLLALAGYLFDLKIPGYMTAAAFASSVCDALSDAGTDAECIYANIRIEEVKLFSDNADNLNYTTNVLRNQTADMASTSIDILVSDKDPESTESYYFSGLSFSAEPLTGDRSGQGLIYVPLSDSSNTCSITNIYKSGEEAKLHQQVVSLCILEKVDGQWQIHKPALLPKIKHGPTNNSVEVETLYTDNIKLPCTNSEGNIVLTSVPALLVAETTSGNETQYQLQFYYGK